MDLDGKKICIWGDSIMKGVILDESNGKYRIPEDNYVDNFARLSGCNIENHASFGMTTTKALGRIIHSVEKTPPEQADIVLLEYGGNDCDYRWNEVSAAPEANHLPKTPLDVFSETLQNIIGIFKKYCITPVFMNLPPIEPKRYFDWITRGLNAGNILKWLGDVNKIYRWQELYNNIASEVAHRNGCPIVDVRKKFLETRDYPALFCSDGIHPNALGQKRILDTFLELSKAS